MHRGRKEKRNTEADVSKRSFIEMSLIKYWPVKIVILNVNLKRPIISFAIRLCAETKEGRVTRGAVVAQWRSNLCWLVWAV